MDQVHLHALLAQVQKELAHGENLDDERRQHLLGVQSDLQRAVEPPTDDTGSAAPLLPETQQERQGRLQAAMVALEGSHPQLASALEQGMVALSNLGL